MFLSFSKINDEWKINSMHVGNYSISNLTAPKLVKMGKEAMSKGRLTSCFVYSWAINKTLRPAPYLQYMDEKKYVEFVKVSLLHSLVPATRLSRRNSDHGNGPAAQRRRCPPVPSGTDQVVRPEIRIARTYPAHLFAPSVPGDFRRASRRPHCQAHR